MVLDNLITTGSDLLLAYVPRLVLAIITLFVGLKLIKWIVGLTRKGFEKREVEPTISNFLSNIIKFTLNIVLLISVIGMIGVETASFVAILAAMGFAIGMSLQGSLSNFAGGVLIVLFKPLKKGEFIEAQGVSGTVIDINIFTTTLKTPDNKRITIPNGPLANGNITNFSREDKRRVDMVVGIGYDDDFKKAKKVLSKIISKQKLTLDEPKPLIRVSNLGDNSVDLNVRFWVNTKDYWETYYDITENIKETFDKKGISFPYPQRDVHLIEE